jgi:threonine aldolase
MATATIDEREIERVRRGCSRFLTHHPPQSVKQALLELAQLADDDDLPDQYGKGAIIESFEREIAELLGQEAAIFMPSGTMAQQAAMRVWTTRRGNPTVAMHPLGHLDRQELFAYERLHGLHGIRVGSPDTLLTLDDLQAIAEPIGALILELPQRELGNRLPAWDELVAISAWARERGIVVHMDGARLWECQPYYDRSYPEICALFDSVYVSFYKTLGGLAGSALAGPAEIMAEARVWQKRHGGTLIRLYPYVLSARHGLATRLPKMAAYYERALAIAAAIRDIPGIELVPDPPQTNMMQLHLRADAAALQAAALELASETGIFSWGRFFPSARPRWQKVELTVGDGALAIETDEVTQLLSALLEQATTE